MMSNALMSDLETQVTQRKQRMVSEILEHKKNSSRAGAAESVDRIKLRLTELSYIVKGMVDGWANVGPNATVMLEEWVAR